MNEKIFHLRRYYFSFLYFSFVYLALLILVLRNNVKPVETGFVEQLLVGITAVVPAYILFKRKTGYIFGKNTYMKLLVLGQLPLVLGTLLSLMASNYIYFFLSYPIFLIAFLLLLPTRKAVERENERA
ncbi:hypothetical protein [Persephonella sp.]